MPAPHVTVSPMQCQKKQWNLRHTDLGDELPSFGPANGVLVHEHPHELGHAYGGVGIIQLE